MAIDYELTFSGIFTSVLFPAGFKQEIRKHRCLHQSVVNGCVASLAGSFIGFFRYNDMMKVVTRVTPITYALGFIVTGLVCSVNQRHQQSKADGLQMLRNKIIYEGTESGPPGSTSDGK